MIVTVLRTIRRALALPGEPALVTWRSIHLAPIVGGNPVAIELSRTAFATAERVVPLTPVGAVVATAAIAMLRIVLACRSFVRGLRDRRRARRAAWLALRPHLRAIIHAERLFG